MNKNKFIPICKVVDRKQALLTYALDKLVLNIGMGGYLESQEETKSYFGNCFDNSLHGRLSKVAKKVVGADINASAIEIMHKNVQGEYVLCDITDPQTHKLFQQKFDCIVLGEVLEHLDCFRNALINIRKLLAESGLVIITVPNAFSLEVIGKMIFKYESCHDEHTCYFSYLTIKRLLNMCNFTISEFYFTLDKRNKYGSIFSSLSYNFMKLAIHVFPQFSQGLLIVARPKML